MNFTTNNKQENIETAKRILAELNVNNISFSGYSDTNGISVYFTASNGVKCRVSDHSTTNQDRMFNELQVSFDKRTIGFGGKTGCVSKFKINQIMVSQFGF